MTLAPDSATSRRIGPFPPAMARLAAAVAHSTPDNFKAE